MRLSMKRIGVLAKTRTKMLPPLNKAADEQKHVFLPLPDYGARIEKLFEGGHSVVFIRSGVATGKTTLAEHLARQFGKYVMVPFTGAGEEAAWQLGTVEAIEKATSRTINKDDLAFRNALKLAANDNLTLVYDEAHTLFSSPMLCAALFKSSEHCRPRVLLFSASGDASTASKLNVATPVEITQKFMWTPPLSYTKKLGTQLKEAGVRLDQKSIEFFMQFCGGHRGIFMAAMHWVSLQQKGKKEVIWGFAETVRLVRNSYANGDWNKADGILSHAKKSRAIHVNGRYESLDAIPEEFIHLLCSGSCMIKDATNRRDLCIHGFILPKHEEAHELQDVNWSDYSTKYKVSNPLMASYYRQVLKQERALQVAFTEDKPQHSADLLLRALPYLLFSKVVSFAGDRPELAKDGLPVEAHYNQAIISVLTEIGYKALSPQSSKQGHGKPDLVVNISEETFVMEGAKIGIDRHLERFKKLENYKNAKHKGLYIIGNDNVKMEKTVRETEGGEVQIIGLVPNIAHTAYTVHVKSKGIERINTFTVDCDLVARRLVLKDDGKPELYSVQSLKSVNLSPSAQSSTTSTSVVWARELARKDGTIIAKSRQDPEGEEELEPAFQVSPKDHPDSRLNNVDDFKTAIKQRKPITLKDVEADQIDIYLQEAGEWQRIRGASTSLRQNTSEHDCYGFLPGRPT